MIGTIIHDRWRILSVLGRGAMGEVFLVENLKLARKEALKILMPLLATDPLFVSRFRREARAINRLRHPNIVSLHDCGQLPDGRFFLSMEYADGAPLSRRHVRGTRFPVPRSLHILGQLALAVDHAHSRGVVHRDLKPDNLIVVGDDDLVKVLDFGIAKIVAPDHNESVAVSSGTELWGTPSYIAPERAQGVGDDPRSDIYSIGCIAYELLVGTPPFAGTQVEILYAHVTTPPQPPSLACPGEVPADLEEIVLTCLEKNPGERFQTAGELFAALRKVHGFPVAKSPMRRRSTHADHSQHVRGTLPPSVPAAYADLRGALRRLAEALLDHGIADPRLVGGVAVLNDHERIVASLEAEQDALEREAYALRDTIVDREASLRFALGELAFAVAPSPAVQRQVADLESRLAAVMSEGDRVGAIEERIEAIASSREAERDLLQGCYDALVEVVNELVVDHLDDDVIHSLAATLALARAQRHLTEPA